MKHLSAAEKLLHELGVTDPSEIDVEAIAFDQGAVVKYRPLKGCEARIIGNGDRAIITVSSDVIPVRQRFSVAHELGHWHHHRGRSFQCRSDDIANYRKDSVVDPERVADRYAADLLLPRYLFEPLANKCGKVTFEAVDALREQFKTSIQATARRLVDYGPEPAMLICHSKAGRRWFKRPNQIPSRWFPREDLDADSYAMDVLYKADSRRSHRAKMPASAWFDRHDADRYEIFEQTHKISEDEILTLLIFSDEEMLEES